MKRLLLSFTFIIGALLPQTLYAESPVLSFLPKSFSQTLPGSGSIVKSLTISNLGDADLIVDVRIAEMFYLRLDSDKIWNVNRDESSTRAVGWLSLSHNVDTVENGSSNIILNFNSHEQFSGVYYCKLLLNHNDPMLTSPDTVLCTLTVTDSKYLSVSSDSVDYSSLWIGLDSTTTITIENNGNDTTKINAITLSQTCFSHDLPIPFNLAPFSLATFNIKFTPDQVVAFRDTLVISSNAMDNPEPRIFLTGKGAGGPQFSIDISSIHDTINGLDSTSDIIRITNSGVDTMSITANITEKSNYESVLFFRDRDDDVPSYTWIDSDTIGGPLYVWQDISPTGQNLNLSDDANKRVFLDFRFPFYENSYPYMYVGSNGYVTFGSGSLDLSNDTMPSTNYPDNIIAGFWDDLDPGMGGDVYYKSFGNYAIVQYERVRPNSGSGDFTFQIVLHENGKIFFYYKSVSTANVTSGSIGIENSDASEGLTVSYLENYIHDEMAVQINCSPNWINILPATGNIAPGEYLDIAAMLNSKDIVTGEYVAIIAVKHDDPLSVSPAFVSCTLSVVGVEMLTAASDTMLFDSVWVGLDSTNRLVLSNPGNDTTIIDTIKTFNDVFVCTTTCPIVIPPFSNVILDIVFTPDLAQQEVDTFVFISNAENNPELKVHVEGNGIVGPSAAIVPGLIHTSLLGEDSTTELIRVSNSGGKDLVFTVDMVENFRGLSRLETSFYTSNKNDYSFDQVASYPNWITVSPMSGTVSPGTSVYVKVAFSSFEYVGGHYDATISIHHNDPISLSPVEIPCSLSVIGIKKLLINEDSLDFGKVWISLDTTMQLTFVNEGSDTTIIASVLSTQGNTVYTHTGTPSMRIPPYGQWIMDVTFNPDAVQLERDTLVIVSNASDHPEIRIPIMSEGICGPKISISPISMHETVMKGNQVEVPVRISNVGGDNLAYNINISNNSRAPAMPARIRYDASHFIDLAKGAPDTRVGIPVTTHRGGSDNFGYSWIDSDEPGGPVYEWLDISVTGTELALGDDDYVEVNFSFPFHFYGIPYSSLFVESNGYLSFDNGSTILSNDPIPDTDAPNGFIAAFWDDLNVTGTGKVFYEDFGNRIVFQYDHVHLLNGASDYTFQIVLHSNDCINIYYQNMTGVLDRATIGIENQDGTDGLEVAYNTAYVKNNFVVEFKVLPKWLIVDVDSGTIAPSGFRDVLVTMNSADLSGGLTSGVLSMLHNVPDTVSPLLVICTLNVQEIPLPKVNFEMVQQSIPESSGEVLVKAFLSTIIPLDVSVPYTVSGTATYPDDHNCANGIITIKAGSVIGQKVIALVNDTINENFETIVLTMGDPTNAIADEMKVHTITILDNECTLNITANDGGQVNPVGIVTVGMGDNIDISATPDNNFYFARWRIISGSVNIDDPNASSTTVRIIDTSAEISAEFYGNGGIKINGLTANDRVYINATSGWMGRRVLADGGSEISGLRSGLYLLSIVSSGKRTTYVPVNVYTGDKIKVDFDLKRSSGLVFGKLDTLRSEGYNINVGGKNISASDDMDNDGDLDLIIGKNNGTVYYYENEEGYFYSAEELESVESGLACFRIVDWNSDNRKDVLTGYANGRIVLHIGDGNGGFVEEGAIFTASEGLVGFELENVNDDKKVDFYLGYSDGRIEVAETNGSLWNVSPVQLNTGGTVSVSAYASIVTLDLSGDGIFDMIVGDEDGFVKWFENAGNNTFIARNTLNVHGTPIKVNGNATLSFIYGRSNVLPSLLISSNDGIVCRTRAVLMGDFNNDDIVNVLDLQIMGMKWGLQDDSSEWMWQPNLNVDPDPFSGTQKINVMDLQFLGNNWGAEN